MTDSNSPRSTGPAQATMREFLAILFRRWPIIAGLFLVTLVTVVTVTLTTPVSFVSAGKVLFVRGEQISVLQPDRRIFNEWEQELGSEVQMVQSAPVLELARERLKASARPGEAPLEVSAGGVDVEVVSKTNALLIGYHHDDPVVAQRVCDAIIHSYIEYRENQLGLAYPKSFFEAELRKVEADVVRLSEERRQYFLAHGLANVQEQTRALIAQSTSLQQQRAEAEANLAEAQANMRAIRDLQSRPGMDMPVTNPTGGADVVQNLKQKVLDQEARVAQLGERYREESPEVTNARGTLATLRGMLEREVSSRIQVLDERSNVLQSRLQSIRDEETRLRTQLDRMPASEARIAQIDRDLDVLKERQKDLVEKADLARVNDSVVSRSRVLLLAPAGPARPTNARDYVRLALAPAFALVVGIGLAFFVDGLDITVRTAHHAEEAVELPVLAVIPERRRRRVANS